MLDTCKSYKLLTLSLVHCRLMRHRQYALDHIPETNNKYILYITHYFIDQISYIL